MSKSYFMPNDASVSPVTPTPLHKESFFWVHYIRAIAAFGVVLVHVAADVITEWGAIPAGHWWIANAYDSLARGCVPIFIMVSGALLLPVQEGLGDFFRKRFNRIFVPFVVWTLLYLVWKKVFYKPDLGLAQSIGLILDAGVWFHLWFFYILTGMYLMTPVLRIFVAHASRVHMTYFLGLWFLLASLIPFADKVARVWGFPGFHLGLPVALAQDFVGYFILGAFLMKYSSKEWIRDAVIIWVACLAVSFLGTGWVVMRTGGFKDTFYDNLAPHIVLYGSAFFVLVKCGLPSIESHLSRSLKSFIVGLSKASFGVYLIHPVIIDILIKGRSGLVIKPADGHPLFMIPAISFLVYFIAYFIVRIIQQGPYLKRIV
jgi:surface polysaccharide O-acyltransferase-like enzyme